MARHSKRRPGASHAVVTLVTGGIFGKAIGLVRELLLAYYYGTGTTAAAFRAAQAGTLIPANLLTSDALSAAFLPLYSNKQDTDSDEARRSQSALFAGVFGLLTIAATLLCLVVVFRPELVVGLIAPGLSGRVRAVAATFAQIMSPGIPLFSLGSLFAYVSMSHGKFAPMSWRAGSQNVGILLGILIAVAAKSPIYIALGFTVGCLTFAVAAGFALRHIPPAAIDMRVGAHHVKDATKLFGRRMSTLLLIPIIGQGFETIERIAGSLIGAAAVAASDYANLVSDTVNNLLAVPVGLALLNAVSGTANPGQQIANKVRAMLPLMLAITMPISATIVVQSHFLVEVIYARGRFDRHSVQVTQQILVGIAVGLWAQSAGYVVLKCLSASERIYRVVAVMSCALILAGGTMLLAGFRASPTLLGIGNTVNGVVVLLLGCYFTENFALCLRCIGIFGAISSPIVAVAAFGPSDDVLNFALSGITAGLCIGAGAAREPRVTNLIRSRLSAKRRVAQ